MPSGGATKVISSGMRFGLPTISGFGFEEGCALLAADIQKLGMDIRSFHEPLKRSVQQVMAPSFQENFRAAGRPEPWQEWAEITPQLKRELHGLEGGSLLVATGLLYKTMGLLNIWNIGPTEAKITELPQNVWYGVIQNNGFGNYGSSIRKHVQQTPRLRKMMKTTPKMAMEEATAAVDARIAAGGASKGNIPARPFVMFQDDDPDKIRDVFGRWFDERVNDHIARGKKLVFVVGGG